jgi:hypothetical protein
LSQTIPEPIDVPSACKLAFRKSSHDRQNFYRGKHGVANLTITASLNNYAQTYAVDLSKIGTLVHSNTTFRGSNGENLAYKGFSGIADLLSDTVCASNCQLISNLYNYNILFNNIIIIFYLRIRIRFC